MAKKHCDIPVEPADGGIVLEERDLEGLPVVMEVMAASFSREYGESWNERQCRSMLALPGTELIVAHYGNQPCGFAIGRKMAGEAELLMIAVHPRYQHRGIGLALLNRFIAKAVEDMISTVFLEVRENNPAQLLYQKLGFKKIGQRRDYYTGENKEKFDAITYQKTL